MPVAFKRSCTVVFETEKSKESCPVDWNPELHHYIRLLSDKRILGLQRNMFSIAIFPTLTLFNQVLIYVSFPKDILVTFTASTRAFHFPFIGKYYPKS